MAAASILHRGSPTYCKVRRGRVGLMPLRSPRCAASPRSWACRWGRVRACRCKTRGVVVAIGVAARFIKGKVDQGPGEQQPSAAWEPPAPLCSQGQETPCAAAQQESVDASHVGSAPAIAAVVAPEEASVGLAAAEEDDDVSVGASTDTTWEDEGPGALPRASDEQLAEGFAAAILRMIDRSAAEEKLTCFHAVRPPPIQMREYLTRMQTFFGCSGACYVLGLLYLEKLLKKHPDIKLSPLSCHRLASTSLTVAVKFHDDVFHDNLYYAKIAGVKVAEFNALESRFIQLLDWKFKAQPDEYDACLQRVCNETGMQL